MKKTTVQADNEATMKNTCEVKFSVKTKGHPIAKRNLAGAVPRTIAMKNVLSW